MILATLEKKRLNGLQRLTSTLRDMKEKVKRNELGCDNRRCKAMVIGLLELNVDEHPELIVEDDNYDGISISEVINTVQHEFGLSEDETHDGKHICTPKSLMEDTIEDVKRAIGVAYPYPDIW
ncbi:hypothetical protein LB507_004388 [Fusarium sp. FIESC RH6]|nr:hypothetical protein LB507_004388 [Fusarium sp. FIESC RH6]